MERKWLIIFLVVIGLNLGIIDYFVFFGGNLRNPDSKVAGNAVVNNQDINDLKSRVSEIENQEKKVEEITVIPTKTKTVITQTIGKSKHISYVPISGGFGKVAYDWTDVPASEFYFNKTDYDGLQEIKFESNMKLVNGNGMAYVRLFDVTHGVAVTGSQVETGNQDNTVVTSTALNFMDGKNLIRVQIKSLTADTTLFNSGRLVITSEY